jgi:hypothetical protein
MGKKGVELTILTPKKKKDQEEWGEEYSTQKSKIVALKKFKNKDCYCLKKL